MKSSIQGKKFVPEAKRPDAAGAISFLFRTSLVDLNFATISLIEFACARVKGIGSPAAG